MEVRIMNLVALGGLKVIGGYKNGIVLTKEVCRLRYIEGAGLGKLGLAHR